VREGRHGPSEHKVASVKVPRHFAIAWVQLHRLSDFRLRLNGTQFFGDNGLDGFGIDPTNNTNHSLIQHGQMPVTVLLNFGKCHFVDITFEGSVSSAVPVALCPGSNRKFVRGLSFGNDVTFGNDMWFFGLKFLVCERDAFEPFGMVREALLPVIDGAVEIQSHVVGQCFGVCLLGAVRYSRPYRQMLK